MELNSTNEMDRPTHYLEKIITITDFISELENELSNIPIPEEKAREIKGHLDNDKIDYHSKAIMVSIPEVNRNEKLKSILSQLSL